MWALLLKIPLFQWAGKWIAGFFPTSGEKAGKILWVAGIAIVVVILFSRFSPPKSATTSTQSVSGGALITHYNQPKMYGIGGCATIKILGQETKELPSKDTQRVLSRGDALDLEPKQEVGNVAN